MNEPKYEIVLAAQSRTNAPLRQIVGSETTIRGTLARGRMAGWR
jgi:hypothetical protein